jgi:predicted permease
MRNTKKIMLVTGIILVLTLGVFVLKNYILAPVGGFKWASPLDLLLLLPAIPFWKIFASIPAEPSLLNIIITFGGTSLFWLLIAYIIGYFMDRKQKNK